jgi:ribonuclease-3
MNELCTRSEIEIILGFRVRNLALYQEAFIHKSAVKIFNVRSNERLEFIGDSVLNLVIARFLFDRYPKENEGFMTKLRTRIVSGKCLSEIAKLMNLDKHIRMNEKAMKQGWNSNPRILEDVFESIIGAIYIDIGIQMATKFILDNVNKYVDFDKLQLDSNYKDILMRYTQAYGMNLPTYAIINEVGPNHKKEFIVSVELEDNIIGKGVANSKKQAEQLAAYFALRTISPLLIDKISPQNDNKKVDIK